MMMIVSGNVSKCIVSKLIGNVANFLGNIFLIVINVSFVKHLRTKKRENG